MDENETAFISFNRSGENMKVELNKLEELIGYHFKNKDLLTMAMRHSSYTNEHRMERIQCNERLEFLGDAVLELLSSEYLYQNYQDYPEGELTKLRASLVCEPTLAYDARVFSLGDYLLMGKGEENTGGRERDSIVSDALEALIGALYLDGGITAARNFVKQYVLNDIAHKKLFYDSKTVLQEIVQGNIGSDVKYRLVKEEGPDHDKKFTAEVLIGERVLGSGTGRTKKAAEQSAAYHAIRKLQKETGE